MKFNSLVHLKIYQWLYNLRTEIAYQIKNEVQKVQWKLWKKENCNQLQKLGKESKQIRIGGISPDTPPRSSSKAFTFILLKNKS